MKKAISMMLIWLILISLFSFTALAEPVENEATLDDAMLDIGTTEISIQTLIDSSDKFVRDHAAEILAAYNEISKLSTIDEANAYIDAKIAAVESSDIASVSAISDSPSSPIVATSTNTDIKAAWLAAAQVAKLAGYPCSAKLIECSVLGVNYNENVGKGGLFRDKIVTTQPYQSCVRLFKSGKIKALEKHNVTFSKSVNSDLYYSLHTCTYSFRNSSKGYLFFVNDIFDFEKSNYDNLFTGMVNNWAWLCQNASILKKINVNINFPI